jgi:hypothetical protein
MYGDVMPRAPQRDACPRCGTPLQYLACRTVHTASDTYLLHVRICSQCKCAYGDADAPSQSGAPESLPR